jgi:hypothetical protein
MNRVFPTSHVPVGIGWILAFAASSVPLSTRAQDASEIIALWQKRQTAVKACKYAAVGKALVPKGAYSRFMPDDSFPAVPKSDFEVPVSVAYSIDFQGGRIRKESAEVLLNSDKGSLHVQRYMNLFDGKQFQSIVPRDANAAAGFPLERYHPEVFIRRDTGSNSAFFDVGDLPLLLSFGIINPLRTNLSPENLLVAPNGKDYRNVATTTHNGRTHVVLRSGPIRASTSYVELWVDAEKDAAVSTWAYFADGAVRHRIDMEYGLYSGHWLIASWTLTRFHESSVELAVNMKTQYHDLEPIFDVGTFHVVPSEGQIVQNNLTQSVVVKGGSGRPDIPLSAVLARERNRGGAWGTFLVGGFIIVVTAVGVACVGHLVRRRFLV